MKLVHNNQKVIALFDAPDLHLATGQTVFEGSIKECQAEIDRLNLTQEEDPYIVERVFKAPSDQVKDGKLPIIPANDILPLDALSGQFIKEEDGYTYMRCMIPKESLDALLENSSSKELDGTTIMELDLADCFVSVSQTDVE